MNLYLRLIHALLKYGISLAGVVGAVIDTVDFKNFEGETNLLEKITEDMPNIVESDQNSYEYKYAHEGQENAMVGPALRALYNFLKEKDKAQI